MKELLITGAWRCGEQQVQALEQMGYAVTFWPDERQAVNMDTQRFEAVICGGLFLTTPIERFPALKCIQVTSAGLDRVPLDYCKAHGITVYNAGGVYSAPMAEFVLGGILQLYKESKFFAGNQAAHRWEKHRGLRELSGKTACIIGTGSVGSAIARRLRAFDVQTVGMNRSGHPAAEFDQTQPTCRLDDLLPLADLVICAMPLTAETAGLFDSVRIAKIKPGAVFVNVARGKVTDQQALVEALQSGQLFGAVLDVFEEEPLPRSSPLWDMEQVILTPHNSFVGEHNGERLFRRVEAAFKDNSADKPGLDLSGIAHTYEVPFSRSPYSVDNLKAYQVLKKIIDEGRYDAIHCHTPMGAVVTRLAARDARKRGTKVIYTAHGFHFYNGAARKNWLLFYPVEKALAKDTDCLITINSEDYNTAKARQFAAGRLELVNGVGVDLSDFQPVTREQKLALRRAYGYSPDDFILIYPADFSARKNQNMLFDTLKLLLEKDKHFRLLLPGSDVEARPFLDYAKSIGVAEHVEALGYRRDIRQLVGLSDVSVSSSRQEGLPINLVEAMALGNPVVATDVRGNRDLVQDGESGYLVPLNDSRAMADRIWSLYTDPEQTAAFGVAGRTLAQDYAVEPVLHRMIEIYQALELL